VIQFRLLEIRVFDVGQRQGYFDLYGRWRGAVLVMDDRNRANGLFRSGLKVEHASTALDWGSFRDFNAACANATIASPHRGS
jgi:hypothetical protein